MVAFAIRDLNNSEQFASDVPTDVVCRSVGAEPCAASQHEFGDRITTRQPKVETKPGPDSIDLPSAFEPRSRCRELRRKLWRTNTIIYRRL